MVCVSLFFLTGEIVQPDIDRDYFKIPELEKIDRVSLTSSRGSVELKYAGNRWRVNDTWEADAQMIKVLFATLQQAEPRRPVSATLKDSVSQWLKNKGIHVTLWEEGISKTAFIAGGNTLKTEAWFLKEEEAMPYIMNIPGYRVYVSGIFELDVQGWRNKRIFDFNWRNFKSLTATFPSEPKQNFEIENKQGYFGIKSLTATDTAKLNNYLDNVSLLFATRFIENGLPAIDSLTANVPAARIEITDIADRSYSLELFALRNKDNEVYGRLAGGQIVTLNKIKIAEIVRKKEYFLPHQGH